MVKQEALILYKKNAGAIRRLHHWIFSGAVKKAPAFENGDLLPVTSEDGSFLGYAYCNRRCSIYGRMVSFDETPPLQAISSHLAGALELRKRLTEQDFTALRLVNGEGDLLPGLVVDKYNNTLVMQISTLGMERLKDFLVKTLLELLKPDCIYEKSLSPSRAEEGLKPRQGLLYGTLPEQLIITEKDIRFLVDVAHGQKTGFFLDQREMRSLVRAFAKEKRALDCFCYSGGFTVSALKGGAMSVTAVDSSRQALELAKQNLQLNDLAQSSGTLIEADVLCFMEQAKEHFDLIILDPPAFAKKRAHVKNAVKAYQRINEMAMRLLSPQGLLFSFSCSYYIDEPLFHEICAAAARSAGRRLKILQRHRQGFDHPLNIFHREGDYLKGLVCMVQ
jgi:23S rRNA (cytosine1962-C5)-methyltransferase